MTPRRIGGMHIRSAIRLHSTVQTYRMSVAWAEKFSVAGILKVNYAERHGSPKNPTLEAADTSRSHPNDKAEPYRRTASSNVTIRLPEPIEETMATSARRVGAETSKTRDALLDCVEKTMLSDGYASVSYRTLASMAGVTP